MATLGFDGPSASVKIAAAQQSRLNRPKITRTNGPLIYLVVLAVVGAPNKPYPSCIAVETYRLVAGGSNGFYARQRGDAVGDLSSKLKRLRVLPVGGVRRADA